MRPGSILSEAGRNIISGTTRVPVYALLIVLTVGLCATAEVITVSSLQHGARTFIDSGGSTRILIAENKIKALPCRALTSYASVDAAGALRQAPETVIEELAGAGFQSYQVTPEFGALLGLPDEVNSGGGAWVSDVFARSLGVDEGSALTSNGEVFRIAGVFVYPDDGRDARLSYAFVLPIAATEDTNFDECWMRSWPEPPDVEGILRSTLEYQDSAATEVSLSQLNRSLGNAFDGLARFDGRVTQWAPHVAFAVCALIGFAQVWLRRLEHASALHAGQSKADMCITRFLETLSWAVLGALLAGAAVYLSAGTLVPFEVAWVFSFTLPSLLAGVAGAIVGTLISSLLIREVALFRYFNER